MSHSAISIALTGAAPRLERAALADLEHHPLDVGRVLADQRLAEIEHERLEVGLVLLDLAVAADALVGDDAHDRVLADDRAAEVDDLHGSRLRVTAGIWPPGVPERQGAGSTTAAVDRDAARRRGGAVEARSERVVNVLPLLGPHLGPANCGRPWQGIPGPRGPARNPQADPRVGPPPCQGAAPDLPTLFGRSSTSLGEPLEGLYRAPRATNRFPASVVPHGRHCRDARDLSSSALASR